MFKSSKGEVFQELGGDAVPFLSLCQSLHQSAESAERTEVLRVLSKDPSHFRRRNEEKKRDGVTTLQAAE